MSSLIQRFAIEDSGMEMLEWAIVATVFAVAMAAGFRTVANNLTDKLAPLTTGF